MAQMNADGKNQINRLPAFAEATARQAEDEEDDSGGCFVSPIQG